MVLKAMSGTRFLFIFFREHTHTFATNGQHKNTTYVIVLIFKNHKTTTLLKQCGQTKLRDRRLERYQTSCYIQDRRPTSFLCRLVSFIYNSSPRLKQRKTMHTAQANWTNIHQCSKSKHTLLGSDASLRNVSSFSRCTNH